MGEVKHRLQWAWARVAYALLIILPANADNRLWLWLLSWAGVYAHSETYKRWRNPFDEGVDGNG